MLDIDNTANKNPVDPNKAGKGRFQQVTSKYQAAVSIPAEEPSNLPKEESSTDKSEQKTAKQASSIIESVVKSADPSIKKRRHPAYKGERVARTYKIPNKLDEWMHNVYEGEGITIQKQVEKAFEEYLSKNWTKFKP